MGAAGSGSICSGQSGPGSLKDRDVYGDIVETVPGFSVASSVPAPHQTPYAKTASGAGSWLRHDLKVLQPVSGDVMATELPESSACDFDDKGDNRVSISNVNLEIHKAQEMPMSVKFGHDEIPADNTDGIVGDSLQSPTRERTTSHSSSDDRSSRCDPINKQTSRASRSSRMSRLSSTASKKAARAKMKFKRAVTKVLRVQQGMSKVAMGNKIGGELTGWFRDVAYALQRGIAADGRRRSLTSTDPGECLNGLDVEFEAPQAEMFGRSRTACGFTSARYYSTMGLQAGQTQPTLKLVGSASASGKSGAFFFLSPDQQLIAKSCTKEDWRELLRILPEYVDYMESARERMPRRGSHPNLNSRPEQETTPGVSSTSPHLAHSGTKGFTETLLPRYLGLYCLRIGDEEPVRVLVMANVFGGALAIDKRYDLKGSTTGRKASKKEVNKSSPVFKDLDWMAREEAMQVGIVTRNRLMDTLRADVGFLTRNKLMDYSLLVGVHDVRPDENTYEAMNVVTVRDKTRICYIGVIDVLTPYVARKRAETFCMGQLMCGRDISCQAPQKYGSRMLKFVDAVVFAS